MHPQEAIVKVATQLFAALGYNGASTRQIADAAGLNIATVNYHVGGKRELYLTVMERAQVAERTALESALVRLAAATDPVPAIHRLIDDYLGFCVEHPEIPALWMHRWLSDADDLTDLERQYARPTVTTVTRTLEATGAIGPGVDVEMAVWTFIWTVHGFAKGGVLDDDGRRRGSGDPAVLRRFRAHLHQSIHRALALPGETW
ncbi:TetR/AcrR family transcriptional regulator [Nonomuraea typhae]|uniref:TetR/AcrR family transcriptional regulator n=1 Tax=Nonomuraea typhae TaxID=2603600 RepID=UPI001FE5C515|nr:TetR/AcrR family transcriptional regulator [Nonomuraea typhae]